MYGRSVANPTLKSPGVRKPCRSERQSQPSSIGSGCSKSCGAEAKYTLRRSTPESSVWTSVGFGVFRTRQSLSLPLRLGPLHPHAALTPGLRLRVPSDCRPTSCPTNNMATRVLEHATQSTSQPARARRCGRCQKWERARPPDSARSWAQAGCAQQGESRTRRHPKRSPCHALEVGGQ